MAKKLTREDCLDWLNYRLELTKQNQIGYFDDFDLKFLSNYIFHRKDVQVDLEQIKTSLIASHIDRVYYMLDGMINWLIHEFSIKTKIKQVDPGAMAEFLGMPRTAELITEYY